MLALPGNVARDAAEVANADGEGGISALPFEELVSMEALSNEMS